MQGSATDHDWDNTEAKRLSLQILFILGILMCLVVLVAAGVWAFSAHIDGPPEFVRVTAYSRIAPEGRGPGGWFVTFRRTDGSSFDEIYEDGGCAPSGLALGATLKAIGLVSPIGGFTGDRIEGQTYVLSDAFPAKPVGGAGDRSCSGQTP
jgi:hypothetical protein